MGRIGEAMQSIATDLGQGGQRTAVLLIACIASLAGLGAVHDATQGFSAFDLDAEIEFRGLLPEPNNVPAVFSAMLLFVASGFALLAAERTQGFPWLVLGVLFAFMGTDELVLIHERLGGAVGVPWLIPYTPVIIAAGAFWLWALTEMSPVRSQRTLWLGGALAWICAQSLEAIWITVGSDSGPTTELSLPEETLEMAGSSMFLLALYVVLRRMPARRLR